MEQHIVKIISTSYITHDVKRITVEKPKGYTFIPGQASEVAVNKAGWEGKKRPFTFTSLNHWENLEFTIKIYEDHNGVTREIEKLHVGDELIIGDAWGAITYKGRGVFIAGGTGVTPFIAILRQLEHDSKVIGHQLIFSNRTSEDIIMKKDFEDMLHADFHIVLTREHVIGYLDYHIDEDYLKETIRNFSQQFYVCGPEKFVTDIQTMLVNLGAEVESVVIEK